MVSFQCESCGDVFTKKKLDAHTNRCWNTSFTCLDCHTQFWNGSYKSHTSCISEDQKYQGALYKDKKAKRQPQQHLRSQTEKVVEYGTGPTPNINDFAVPPSPERRPPKVRFHEPEPPPPAPSPPAAAPTVNVFDYLEPDSDGESATSSSSSYMSESGSDRSPSPEVGRGTQAQKGQQQPPRPASASSSSTQQPAAQGYYPPYQAYNQQYPPPYAYAPSGQPQPQPPYPQSGYWTYPPQQQPFATPGHPSQAPPHAHSTSHSPLPANPPTITRDTSALTDSQRSISGSKRKRSPSIAGPTGLNAGEAKEGARKRELHSGLTGGLNRLLAAPDVSTGHRGSEERSPLSPKKRQKQKSEDAGVLVRVRDKDRHGRERGGEDGDEDRRRRKDKHGSRRKVSDETVSTALTTTTRSSSGRSRRHDRHGDSKSRKALTYPSQQRHGESRSEFFLSLIDKGFESVKGQSLWGVLKMFHEGRGEEVSGGQGDDRESEEKRLLKGLRCKVNRQGEIVLFARGESEKE